MVPVLRLTVLSMNGETALDLLAIGRVQLDLQGLFGSALQDRGELRSGKLNSTPIGSNCSGDQRRRAADFGEAAGMNIDGAARAAIGETMLV